LGRKTPGKALLASHPAIFLAFDLLEHGGDDWRERPLWQRREALEALLAAPDGGLARIRPPPTGTPPSTNARSPANSAPKV
jgi:DNA ligase-1